MSEYIEIHWTSSSLDEARKMAKQLVEQRVVACAQIVPWVESRFLWDNELECAQESKVIFKTHQSKEEDVRSLLEEGASYDVPEITTFIIENLNESYKEWLEEQLLLAKS